MTNTVRYSPDLVHASREDIYYALTMFPYPSGSGLHCGHASVFTINDVHARFQRMQGKTVFQPFGFDAFGLPTENYAMKMGKPAYEVTEENKTHFIEQLQALQLSFDRERIIDTSQPDYYKWTQRIFHQLYKAGLVYRDVLWVNWCPDCQTVLANDQVVDGKCERCKHEIIQKKMPQWFIKITDYADRLLEDLDTIDWPEETKIGQRNWIGKSVGAEIDFIVDQEQETIISCFTTRPDTIYGVTAVVLAPENTMLDHLLDADHQQAVLDYRQQALAKTAVQRQQDSKDKTGVFSGLHVLHPLTDEPIPVRFADYVLADYGSGAVMMVPAHDERDFAFAKKFGIANRQVIASDLIGQGDQSPRDDVETLERIVIDAIIENDKGEFLLQKDSHRHFVGGGIEEGDTAEETVYKEIFEETGYKNIRIERKIMDYSFMFAYRIPKKKNQKTNSIWYHVKLLNDEQVPSEVDEGKHILERVKKEEVSGKIEWPHHARSWDVFNRGAYTGEGILVNSEQFNGMSNDEAKQVIIEHLAELGKGRKKITYKLRDWSVSRQRYRGSPIPVYYDENNEPQLIPEDELPVKLPLDIENYKPKGKSPLEDHPTFPIYEKDGKQYRRECDTLDTFMCSSFYFLRYPDAHNHDELISRELANKMFPIELYTGGKEHTVGHLLYARFIHKFLYDQGYVDSPEPFVKLIHQGMVLGADGRKMGKRYGNGVDPLEVIEQYGVDAVRTYLMFMGPVDQDKIWNDNALRGVKKFLDRVERLLSVDRRGAEDIQVMSLTQETIQGVTHDIQHMKLNTAVSKLMILTNALYDAQAVTTEQLEVLTLLLAPFAPVLTEHMWSSLGHHDDVHYAAWPVADISKIQQSSINLPIQINGKVRGAVDIMPGISEEDALVSATAHENIQKWLEGKEIMKVIYVQDKIMNIIVK